MLKNDKIVAKKILTTKGWIKIERTILRPKDSIRLNKLREIENSSCVIPLDIALGIDKLPFKMTREMMCEVAFWAQNQTSFKATELILKKIYGEGIVA